MRRLCHHLLTLLLIALIAMPAVSPPVLRHRHEHGETSHQHVTTTAVTHKHLHAHGAKHSHSARHVHVSQTTAKHAHEKLVARVTAVPVTHTHLIWFGIEWSVPVPASERSDSTPPTASVEQWVPLIPEVVLPDGGQDGSSIVAAACGLPSELEPRVAVRSVIFPLNEPVMARLCDIARRERSGVLVV